jgi:hypothetical protein
MSSKRLKNDDDPFTKLASSIHPPDFREYPFDADPLTRTVSFSTADQGNTDSCGIWANSHAIAHALMTILRLKKPITNVTWENDKSCDEQYKSNTSEFYYCIFYNFFQKYFRRQIGIDNFVGNDKQEGCVASWDEMFEKINLEFFTSVGTMIDNVKTLGSNPTIGKKMNRERWDELVATGSDLHSPKLISSFRYIIKDGYLLSRINRLSSYISISPYYFILEVEFIDDNTDVDFTDAEKEKFIDGLWITNFEELTSNEHQNQIIFDKLQKNSLSELHAITARKKKGIEPFNMDAHAMVVKHSIDGKWLVKNSWKNWGDNGELWIPSQCFSIYSLTEICFTHRPGVRGGKIKSKKSKKTKKTKKSKKTKKRRTN